jgi:hypothetical protein
MSVALVITYHPGHQGPDYLPLATEHEYHAHWLPLATAAKLLWLPAFATGTAVPLADLPAVIDELARICTLVPASALPAEARAKLITRARLAQQFLTALDPHTVAEVFIG